MKVETGSVVTMAYDITREDGEIIESSEISGPITFLQGRSGLIPGLDKRILGMNVGDEETFEFPPEEAFGRIEDAPKRPIARGEFPADAVLEAGTQFEAGAAGGQKILLRVVETPDPDTVVVQMLHPLAGQQVGMTVNVLAVRAATAAESSSGKVRTAPPPPPSAR